MEICHSFVPWVTVSNLRHQFTWLDFVLIVTHGKNIRPMSMHHRVSIRISILSYHQWPGITNFTHCYSQSLTVTHGHSWSLMDTYSLSWYKVMTNVHALPGFGPMSLHHHGHSKSLTITHGRSFVPWMTESDLEWPWLTVSDHGDKRTLVVT